MLPDELKLKKPQQKQTFHKYLGLALYLRLARYAGFVIYHRVRRSQFSLPQTGMTSMSVGDAYVGLGLSEQMCPRSYNPTMMCLSAGMGPSCKHVMNLAAAKHI